MKIVIVKLSSLGDIVHSMIALQFIKKTYPDSKIDWVVEEKFKDIILDPGLNMFVNSEWNQRGQKD